MPDRTTVVHQPDLAVGYARAAYEDLIIRQFPDQRADQAHHYGGTLSPDLIVAGTSPVENPQASFGTAASYAEDPGVPLAGGTTDYLYPRTRMAQGVEAPGYGRLFVGVAPPSALLWPDRLELLSTTGGQSSVDVDVPAGDVGVAGEPFVAGPDVDAAATLGCYVSTIEHPVFVPTLENLLALARWLYDTPGFAQRCAGEINPDTALEQHFTYEHRGRGPVEVMFHIRWQDCPDGWEVGLHGDHGITIPTTAASGSQGIGVRRGFDGDFTAELTWHLAGGALETGTRFRLTVYLVDEDGAYLPLGGRMLRPPGDRSGRGQEATGPSRPETERTEKRVSGNHNR